MLHIHARALSAAVPLIVCFAATACSEVDPPNLVSSSVPVWRDSAAWHFDDEPARVIGTDPADPAAWLGAVEAAAWLHDGRVAVTVPGLNQVRIYDATGNLLHAFGGTGRSAGRFASIGAVWSAPDGTLAVVSTRDGRLELFDTAAAVLRSLTLEPVVGSFRMVPIGGFADGSAAAWAPAPHPVLPVPGTRLRDTLIVARFDTAGAFIRRLAAVAGMRYVVFDDGNGARQLAAPFAGPAAATVHDSLLIVAESDRPGILEIDLDGDTVRSIRWSVPTDVTETLRQEYAAFILAGAAPDGGALIGRFLDLAGFPDRLPAIRTIRVDDRGFRWIEPWRLPWDSATDWTIIDPGGRWLGSVAMPRDFHPTAFRDNTVLGLVTARDQSQRPAIFVLQRSSAVGT